MSQAAARGRGYPSHDVAGVMGLLYITQDRMHRATGAQPAQIRGKCLGWGKGLFQEPVHLGIGKAGTVSEGTSREVIAVLA